MLAVDSISYEGASSIHLNAKYIKIQNKKSIHLNAKKTAKSAFLTHTKCRGKCVRLFSFFKKSISSGGKMAVGFSRNTEKCVHCKVKIPPGC